MQQAALRRASVLQRRQTNAFLQLSPLVRLVSSSKTKDFLLASACAGKCPSHARTKIPKSCGRGPCAAKCLGTSLWILLLGVGNGAVLTPRLVETN